VPIQPNSHQREQRLEQVNEKKKNGKKREKKKKNKGLLVPLRCKIWRDFIIQRKKTFLGTNTFDSAHAVTAEQEGPPFNTTIRSSEWTTTPHELTRTK
jgi:hypothetical protein